MSYKVEILSWLFWMHDFISRAYFWLQKFSKKCNIFMQFNISQSNPVVQISWLCSARAVPQNTNGDNFIYFSIFIFICKRIFLISRWRFFSSRFRSGNRERKKVRAPLNSMKTINAFCVSLNTKIQKIFRHLELTDKN